MSSGGQERGNQTNNDANTPDNDQNSDLRDDSIAAQVVEQAMERFSAENVFAESRQRGAGVLNATSVAQNIHQQQSSVSEGVASAGHPVANMDRMGEFVPGQFQFAYGDFETGHGGAARDTGMFEGETSGGNEPLGGSNVYFDGEITNTGTPTATQGPARTHMRDLDDGYAGALSPMDMQHGSQNDGQYNIYAHDNRLNYEDVNESSGQKNSSELQRVPSDIAMVTGLSDGEVYDQPQGAGYKSTVKGTDPSDSNLGCILAGMGGAQTAGEVEIAQMPHLDRPSDADIIAWENQIRDQQARNKPLVGDLEDIGALMEEYSRGSDVFKTKIADLSTGYAKIRRARGDGNCFFRSFIFSYIENMVLKNDYKERDRIMEKMVWLQTRLKSVGYEELVLEGPMELLLGLLGSIGNESEPLTLELLEKNMRSDDISNYIVFLMRIITSAEIKLNSEFFAPFIMGITDMSVEEFCTKCVDPMGEESDHIQLVALTNALQIPVRVIYLDNSASPIGQMESNTHLPSLKADTHDFTPSNNGEASINDIQIHLLYRPGHYDILYMRN
eukprot:jgi/Picsp_1/4008/NSC_01520-R1_ubiquitin thioesterase otubain-like protein